MASNTDWWPDWRGDCAAVVASGPSTKKNNLGQLNGRMRVIAIKENVELCPFADVVYGCDAAWWKNSHGLKNYSGLKISFARQELAPSYPDIRFIEIEKDVDRFIWDKPGVVGSGGNSGFQAVNLALSFGATRIMLIGFDMHDRSGVHWFGRARGVGRNNPDENNFRRWRRAFEQSAALLKSLGVDVVNTSQISALKCFRQASVEQTLKEWER